MCFVYAHRTYPCIIIHEQGKNIKKTKQKNWFDMCDAPMSVLQYLFKLYCLRIHFFFAVHTCVNAGLFFAMLRLFTKCGICRYNTYSTEFSWWISHLFSIFSITMFGKRLMKIYSLEWGYNLKSRECEVYCLVFRILLNSFWTNFTNSSSSSMSLEKMKIKYFSKIDLSSIFAQKNK